MIGGSLKNFARHGMGVSLGLALAVGASAHAAPARTKATAKPVAVQPVPAKPVPGANVPVETRSIEELHKAALAEGGVLVMYAGGDFPTQYDAMRASFEKTFPGMKLNIVADFSKFHSARVENQVARGRLEADTITMQNLQDFDRWKAKGWLFAYKPKDWDMVPDNFKDADATYVATNMVTFANVVSNKVTDADLPKSYLDYLDPRFKDQLSLTYPTDDDAVLFQFKLIVDKYGWGWLEKLVAQNPTWVRGTPQSNAPVRAGTKLASFTSVLPVWADAKASGARTVFFEKDPFVSWASPSAIFKSARHKEAAKLFIAWRLSLQAQQRSVVWSVRKDVPQVDGGKPITAFNTNPEAFKAFMHDRASVELFRAQVEQYIGPVQGPAPTGKNEPGPFFQK